MSAEKRKREEENEKLADQTATTEKPTEKERRSNEESNETSTDTVLCSICFEEVCSEHKKSLNCNHLFHDTCINKWLEKAGTCPMCRSPALHVNNSFGIGDSTLRMDTTQLSDGAWRDLSAVIANFDRLHSQLTLVNEGFDSLIQVLRDRRATVER